MSTEENLQHTVDKAAEFLEEKFPEVIKRIIFVDKVGVVPLLNLSGRDLIDETFKTKAAAEEYIAAIYLFSPDHASVISDLLLKNIKKYYLGPERTFSDDEIRAAVAALRKVPSLWTLIQQRGHSTADEPGIAELNYEISELCHLALGKISWLTNREKTHKRYSRLIYAAFEAAQAEAPNFEQIDDREH